ncbi:hypothetical protein NUKP28_47510 [Klebsiella quasipneumoniae]|nr:hypothetical protein NUKP28_47510 [Klebsiella quasipneumoniae]
MKVDDSINKAKTTPAVFLTGLNHPPEKSCRKKKKHGNILIIITNVPYARNNEIC